MKAVKSNEDFSDKASTVHLTDYNYSLVEYVNMDTKVEIICNKGHPNFWQTPQNHLNGHGCALCGFARTKEKQMHKTEPYVAFVRDKHSNFYSYPRTEYKGAHQKIIVTCPSHGDFLISADAHKRGIGCKECAKYGYRKSLPGCFYVLISELMVKVGITNRKPEIRLSKINRSGHKFKLHTSVFSEDGSKIYDLEKSTLSWLKSKYSQPTEKFDGSTECFLEVNLEELLNHVLPAAQ